LITTGTQTIAGLKTFNDAITANSGIAFLNGVMPSITSSYYSGIGGNSQGISIVTRPVSTNYTNNLYFASSSNTFTFPNATGTLALTSDLTDFVTLSTAQTISGIKTFSSSILSSGIGFFSTIGGTNYGGIVGTPTYFQISAGGGSSILLKSDNGTNAIIINTLGKVDFGSTIGNGTYTYTLPSATGTLALTSALSGYLPLAGGTLTGALGGTSASFSGNVGVGVAATAAKLQVLGYVNDATLGNVSIRTTDNLNNSLVFSHNTSFVDIRSNEGLRFYTGTSFLTLALTLASTGAATFSGQVGIGTAPNTVHLDVQNTQTGTMYPVAAFRDNSTNGNALQIQVGTGEARLRAVYYSAVTAMAMTFWTGNSSGAEAERMRINGDGNVGIGTSSPDYPLTVQANSGAAQAVKLLGRSVDNISILSFHNYANTTQYGYIAGIPTEFRVNSGSSIPITFTNADTERMRITSGGDVGIGATPTSFGSSYTVLDVYNATVGGYILARSPNVTAQISVDNNTAMYVQTRTNHPIAFVTNNAERMRITSGGNVLIGTTTDAGQKLQVNGTALVYDELRMRSSSYGASYNTSLRSNTSAVGILQFGNNGDNYILAGNTAAGGYLIFRVNCATESITAGTEAFRLASNAAATFTSSVTATSFFESSDSRLKTLIQDNYQTKGIASITPKLYTKNGKVELGYYAQDLVGVLDSAVSKGSDDMLSLSYREVLVAKVYALEQEIKELKAKMN
jgi:hypothetical protein